MECSYLAFDINVPEGGGLGLLEKRSGFTSEEAHFVLRTLDEGLTAMLTKEIQTLTSASIRVDSLALALAFTVKGEFFGKEMHRDGLPEPMEMLTCIV